MNRKLTRWLLALLAACLLLCGSAAQAEEPRGIEIMRDGRRADRRNTLLPGEVVQLEYRLNPDYAETEVTWESDDPNVVFVDSHGRLTANNPGITIVRVRTSNRKSNRVFFKVPEEVPEDPPLIVVNVDEEHFPDDDFREYVSYFYDMDCDGGLNGYEIDQARVMDDMEAEDATGLGNLTALEAVIIADTELRTPLDLSQLQNLKVLEFHHGLVDAVDVSHNPNLERLWFEGMEDSGIKTLDLHNNHNLHWLYAELPDLATLDISRCPELVALVQNTEPDEDDGLLCFGDEHDDCFLSFMEGTELITESDVEGVDISEVIPDEFFRAYIEENFDDGDGILTGDEIEAVTDINLDGRKDQGIAAIQSVEGLEIFTALRRLTIRQTGVHALDVTANTALKYLDIRVDGLSELDMTKNAALEELHLCNVARIDLSHNPKLSYLNLWDCSIKALDLSKNTALTRIEFISMPLQSLDIRACAALQTLELYHCPVKALDLSGNTKLLRLAAADTEISSLDISGAPSLVNTYRTAKPTLEEEFGCDGYSYDCDTEWLFIDPATRLLDGTALDTLTLPADLTRAEAEAFAGVDADVIVVQSTAAIGSRAFANCPNLFRVYLSKDATLSDDAFEGCRYRIEIIPMALNLPVQ